MTDANEPTIAEQVDQITQSLKFRLMSPRHARIAETGRGDDEIDAIERAILGLAEVIKSQARAAGEPGADS